MSAGLPPTWALSRLGDVCMLNPKKRPGLDPRMSVSFVPMAAINENEGAITATEERTLLDVNRGYTPFEEDDVLMAKITPCMENGKAAVARGLTNGLGFGSTEFHVLRCGGSVIPEWVFYFIRRPEFLREAAANFTGSAGQRRVPETFLARSWIPVPPVSEQRWIVGMLREAAQIAALEDRARHLGAAFIPALLRDRFSKAPRGQLCDALIEPPQNGLYRSSEHYGTGTPIIRIGDFHDTVLRDVTSLQRLRATPAEVVKYGLNELEVLINRVNSIEFVGKSLLVECLSEPTVFESNMMRLVPDHTRVDPLFLIHALQTPDVQAQIRTRAKLAVNQASINQTDVLGLRIPLPGLDDQRQFAATVAVFLDATSSERRAKPSKGPLGLSLLANAFTGDLSAKWRDLHARELATEAGARDALLGRRSPSATEASMEVATAEAAGGATSPSPDTSDLHPHQVALLAHLPNEAFTTGTLAKSLSTSLSFRPNPDTLRRHLDVLVARGLVLHVARANLTPEHARDAFGGFYRRARGAVLQTGDSSPGTRSADEVRTSVLEELVGRLRRSNA